MTSGRKIYRPDLLELPCIDYLSFAEDVSPEHPREALAGHAELVHNVVVKCRTAPELRPKAAWLRDYHNWHISSRDGFEDLIVQVAVPEIYEEDDKTALDSPSGLEAMRLHPEALSATESVRLIESGELGQRWNSD